MPTAWKKAVESTEGHDPLPYPESVQVSLKKFNVEQINPVGERVDPQHHEAMSMVPAPDAEPNSVVAVVQKG